MCRMPSRCYFHVNEVNEVLVFRNTHSQHTEWMLLMKLKERDTDVCVMF